MLGITRRGFVVASSCLVAARGARAADAPAASAPGGHALSLYGDVKYPPGFTHFDYVNPDAPKGGTVRVATIGTFDSVNPFILKGVSFVKVTNDLMSSGAMFDSLMAGAADEPSTAYGLIAEGAEVAPDRLSVTFTLRPEARFHDGSPVTPDDVVWTFETLMTKGHPVYRVSLADVERAEKIDARRVRFVFKTSTDRQLPLTVAGLPVLPAAWWQGKAFDEPTLEPLLGNGNYRMARVEPGRSITWERVRDYWAQDLPVVRGTGNFDTVHVDYYRDMTVQREAFKAGLIDVREEFTAADWANAYDFPAVQRGLVVKRQVEHDVPQGMQAFVFNARRPLFQDPRVRRALGYAFDFVWYNKTYFYDSYTRTRSYFENSELAARDLPSGDELALLEKYRGRVPESVFTTVYDPPTYADPAAFRNGMREAVALLREAGWTTQGGKLVNAGGQPFAFEFLLDEPRLERVVLPFTKNLERLGIAASVRMVDDAQYDVRVREFDFDMISIRYGASLNPGTELRNLYSGRAADTPGSPNVGGVKDPVVDELIELVVNAETRPDLVTRTRALDRVLLHGYHCVPNYYSGNYRVAHWDKFGMPPTHPRYASMTASVFPTWWFDAGKGTAVAQRQEELKTQQQ